ncbi:class I SAM-dependent methyltransferase [Ulvibacter antarcticus]|uniref:Ubiquinone/menaquinone biosynthesis C-methylase UbiE n=1 Tax=Ulvibacter antarcticus TaxID=442714 RepID=A0A3L9YVN6_9FLAO|nr:class I SAM-dependent methyltransferase [Ulvibacter antarcticus]RMA58532.1 ubiquinone/menaquinone biosynthesis C-methylase UbiE [Ulvibacter antarcticus]
MAKYDTIGKTYNQTRKADPFLVERLYRHLNVIGNGNYLDIGCGSGNYTNALYERGANIIGIDPSVEMLQKARSKNPIIDYKLGVAEKINLPDDCMDGVTAFLTIHHWTDLEKGFQEIGRILKPGGKFVIFHSTPEQMKGYWLNEYFPKMLKDSMKLMHTSEVIKTAMQKAGIEFAGIENYSVSSELEDLFLQCGKYDPEIYFRPEIRSGISSFAAVANRDEVTSGLEKLRKDIDNGVIQKIMESYESDVGDYLYILGQKTK